MIKMINCSAGGGGCGEGQNMEQKTSGNWLYLYLYLYLYTNTNTFRHVSVFVQQETAAGLILGFICVVDMKNRECVCGS